MKILFVAKRYYTNKDLVGDRFGRLFHLPRKLAEAGHEVGVVAIDYKTFKYEKLKIGALDLVSLPSRSRGLRMPAGIKADIRAAMSPDVVVGSGHLHLAWTAARYAAKSQSKFLIEAYDYYPAFLLKPLQGAGKSIFERICRNADGCIAASERLGELMGRFNNRVKVIENGFDPENFSKRDREASLARLGLERNRKYVCFIGSASEELGYGDFVTAISKLRRTRPEIMGLHAGVLNSTSKESEDVRSLGQCTQDQVVDILSACSCGVVPYRETLQVAYSNSCKLVEYMAMGLPIVATRSGDNERVLGDAGGKLVSSSNPSQLSNAILEQLDNPIAPPYPEQWSWENLGGKLERFLNEVGNG